MEKDLITTSPAELITQALEKGLKPEQLDKMLDLQERYDATQARKAYNKAMSAFKVNAPEIGKDKQVNFGQGKAKYTHASLYNVTTKINSELSKNGLSASWTTKQNGQIEVTCKITHELGHSEQTTLKADADSSGSKNSIQAIGSTITYLERYTLLALTGLATKDQDDDGQASETIKYITEEQQNIIQDNLIAKNIKEDRLLKVVKADSIGHIQSKDYQRSLTLIKDAQ